MRMFIVTSRNTDSDGILNHDSNSVGHDRYIFSDAGIAAEEDGVWMDAPRPWWQGQAPTYVHEVHDGLTPSQAQGSGCSRANETRWFPQAFVGALARLASRRG